MKKFIYLIITVPFIFAGCSRDPIADFFISSNPVDVYTYVDFTNNSIDADRFEWEMGDGTRYTTFDVSHYYENRGTYTVTLFAYRGNRKVSRSTQNINVQSGDLEITVVEYYEDYIVPDASILLFETPELWDTGDPDKAFVEGFSDVNGIATITELPLQEWYMDIYVEYNTDPLSGHHNWWLAQEDFAFATTPALTNGNTTQIVAFVDYWENTNKSTEVSDRQSRKREMMRLRSIQRMDQRSYEKALEKWKENARQREQLEQK